MALMLKMTVFVSIDSVVLFVNFLDVNKVPMYIINCSANLYNIL